MACLHQDRSILVCSTKPGGTLRDQGDTNVSITSCAPQSEPIHIDVHPTTKSIFSAHFPKTLATERPHLLDVGCHVHSIHTWVLLWCTWMCWPIVRPPSRALHCNPLVDTRCKCHPGTPSRVLSWMTSLCVVPKMSCVGVPKQHLTKFLPLFEGVPGDQITHPHPVN